MSRPDAPRGMFNWSRSEEKLNSAAGLFTISPIAPSDEWWNIWFRAAGVDTPAAASTMRPGADTRSSQARTIAGQGAVGSHVIPHHAAAAVVPSATQVSQRSPVMVRADGAQGHGVGSAVGGVVQEWADTFTFLNAVLGIEQGRTRALNQLLGVAARTPKA